MKNMLVLELLTAAGLLFLIAGKVFLSNSIDVIILTNVFDTTLWVGSYK